MDVQFKCPCGEVLAAHENDVHKTIACGRCGRVLEVPGIPVAVGPGARREQEEIQKAREVVEADASAWQPSPAQPVQAQPGQPTRAQPVQPAPAESVMETRAGVSGLAVASLVLGIVGPFLGILAIVAGILAVVFGGVAVKSIGASPRQGRGMAIGGMVLGGIDTLLGISFVLAAFAERPQGDSLDIVCCLISSLF